MGAVASGRGDGDFNQLFGLEVRVRDRDEPAALGAQLRVERVGRREGGTVPREVALPHRVLDVQPQPSGGRGNILILAPSRGGPLRPRHASTPLRRRSRVRRSDPSPRMVHGARWALSSDRTEGIVNQLQSPSSGNPCRSALASIAAACGCERMFQWLWWYPCAHSGGSGPVLRRRAAQHLQLAQRVGAQPHRLGVREGPERRPEPQHGLLRERPQVGHRARERPLHRGGQRSARAAQHADEATAARRSKAASDPTPSTSVGRAAGKPGSGAQPRKATRITAGEASCLRRRGV